MSTENEPIFTLEPWRMEYAPAVSKYADNTKTAENLRSNFPHPYTLKDAEEFIYMCMQADTCRDCYRAIVLAGEAVGKRSWEKTMNYAKARNWVIGWVSRFGAVKSSAGQ